MSGRCRRIGGGRGRRAVSSLAVTLVHDRLRNLICEIVTTARAPRCGTLLAVAQEAAFDQHGRIFSFPKHPKVRGLHATVGGVWERHQMLLNTIGERTRDGRMVVGLKSADAAASRIIEMHAHEDRVLLAI